MFVAPRALAIGDGAHATTGSVALTIALVAMNVYVQCNEVLRGCVFGLQYRGAFVRGDDARAQLEWHLTRYPVPMLACFASRCREMFLMYILIF